MAIFDLPEKSHQLNVKQYNGYFGCCTCFHPGQPSCGVHVYPYRNVNGILHKNKVY